jgi:putative Ca2+/H+ antiporter (TMEM165/GDT1 family)
VEWITAGLAAFVLIIPVELPDKTFIATLVLSTRYQHFPVWVGVVAAFFVQCVVAVAAGRLLTLLPTRPIQLVAAALFAIGAVILFRSGRRSGSEQDVEQRFAGKINDPSRTGWRAALTSFAVLFTAEWGDLSQLLTAGLVASGRPAIPVFIGSWLALAAVGGAAVLLGKALLAKVRLSIVSYVGATVCAVLAVITVIAALT